MFKTFITRVTFITPLHTLTERFKNRILSISTSYSLHRLQCPLPRYLTPRGLTALRPGNLILVSEVCGRYLRGASTTFHAESYCWTSLVNFTLMKFTL
jgi:hypothetical protein